MNHSAEIIKQSVTMREMAERYGFEPNMGGFIKCPFHQGDHTASLKIYPDNKGFHCFGCGAHGSVIDFAMKLFDLTFPQAIIRISADFNLGLTAQRPTKLEASCIIEERKKREKEKNQAIIEYMEVAAEHRYLWEATKYFAPTSPDFIHPLYAEAVKKLSYLEWWLDEHIEAGK